MSDQEIIDFGWNDYMSEIEKESFVDVGILPEPGAKSRGDLTLAELAVIQENGTQINVTPKMRNFLAANGLPLSKDTKEIVIPSRPYMRQTFDENESILASLISEKELAIIEKRETRRGALNEIGQTHKQQIQRAMSTKGKFKENHPFTVKRKKSSMPLIDTGLLRQAIDYEVG